MEDYKKSTIDELAEHLVFLRTQNIPTTVFLGAGVSASAGIPLANQIVKDIKVKYSNTVKNIDEDYGKYMRALTTGVRKMLIKQYTDKPKLNLAHLYLSSFVKYGYIDRILTTNFDPLAVKSLALNNIFPSVHDLAESKSFRANEIVDPSIFYIHGRYNGYYVLNTSEEVESHSKIVRDLFQDTARNRCWIIIGYSGENDPLYRELKEIDEYKYGLYWIGYKDNPPPDILKDGILKNKDAYFIDGFDADNFFIKLANKINIEKPEILNNPIGLVKNIVSSIVDIEKDDKNVSITDKVLKELDQHIELNKSIEESVSANLIQQARDIWIYEKYDLIDTFYGQIKVSNNIEAKKYLSNAINNFIVELRKNNSEKGKIIELNDLEKELSNSIGSNNIHNDAVNPKSKEYIDPASNSGFYNGTISISGMQEAKKILKTDKIRLIGKRVFESDLMRSYLYWMFIKEVDFKTIEDKFNNNKTLNVIGEISKKKKYDLSINKSHFFIPTNVGDEAKYLNVGSETPALLHLQITYRKIAKSDDIEPIELLIGKHLGEINISGFITDAKSHEQSYYSKIIDNYLQPGERKDLLNLNKKMYYPFFRFMKNFKKEYTIPQKVLRIPVVSDESCNYKCVFCCYGNSCKPGNRLITTDELKPILEAALSSGCKKVMFTGGEPLLLDQQKLLSLVKTATEIIENENFWITTNGSLLTHNKVDQLIDSGLRKIHISVPSPKEKYLHCVNPKGTIDTNVMFDIVKDNVSYAITKGLKVRIDIPLNSEGAKTFEDIEQIINEFNSIGVKNFIYFPLHKTKENASNFTDLYVEPDLITYSFYTSDKWRIWHDNDAVYYVSKDNIKILIGADTYPQTDKCKQYRCGYYCQGTYASYLLADRKGLYIRACHREFQDGRNIFRIKQEELINDKTQLILTFKKVWNYANEN